MNLLVREHAIGNVTARIASILILLCGDKPGPIHTTVRVNRIARAIAMDGDSVNRILRDWAQCDYISYDGSKISILDLEAIRGMAG